MLVSKLAISWRLKPTDKTISKCIIASRGVVPWVVIRMLSSPTLFTRSFLALRLRYLGRRTCGCLRTADIWMLACRHARSSKRARVAVLLLTNSLRLLSLVGCSKHVAACKTLLLIARSPQHASISQFYFEGDVSCKPVSIGAGSYMGARSILLGGGAIKAGESLETLTVV